MGFKKARINLDCPPEDKQALLSHHMSWCTRAKTMQIQFIGDTRFDFNKLDVCP
jgi:hypothetical protein